MPSRQFLKAYGQFQDGVPCIDKTIVDFHEENKFTTLKLMQTHTATIFCSIKNRPIYFDQILASNYGSKVYWKTRLILHQNNALYMRVFFESDPKAFWVYFQGMNNNPHSRNFYFSQGNGKLSNPSYSLGIPVAFSIKYSYHFIVSLNNVYMISFPLCHLANRFAVLTLTENQFQNEGSNAKTIWSSDCKSGIETQLYETNTTLVYQLSTTILYNLKDIGFVLMYSFLTAASKVSQVHAGRSKLIKIMFA